MALINDYLLQSKDRVRILESDTQLLSSRWSLSMKRTVKGTFFIPFVRYLGLNAANSGSLLWNKPSERFDIWEKTKITLSSSMWIFIFLTYLVRPENLELQGIVCILFVSLWQLVDDAYLIFVGKTLEIKVVCLAGWSLISETFWVIFITLCVVDNNAIEDEGRRRLGPSWVNDRHHWRHMNFVDQVPKKYTKALS